jgi:xanthine dehydrogenase YagR molybdenum-binding subunit
MSDSTILKMDEPIPSSLLDVGAQGLIGRPLDRVDGPLKVAGRATYSAEYALPDLAYGFLVQAKVGRGRITAIDTAEALAMPGVIDVVIDLDTFIRNPQQGGSKKAPTQGVEEIHYFGQVVAIVVAETFEQARDAATRVRIACEDKDGLFDFEGRLHEAHKPKGGSTEPHVATGDVDAALAQAPVVLDAVWTTPSQNSAAMEPHASTAVWEGDALTIYGSYQMPASDKQQLAKALGLKADKVRILSAYVGGGFGSKLGISIEAVAGAIAARKLGRPVKTVMSRQQVFDATVRRSNTHQRIRLGAGRDGRLTTVVHETVSSNIEGEEYFEPAGVSTHFLYAGENRRITHDLLPMNWLLSGSMRAPGEAAGMLALEGAMDELAEKLGMDPVALRKLNDPERDPLKDIPFSTRQLTRCLDEGAEAFGWKDRNPTPGGRREGEWLIGHGMASSARSNQLQESQARVSIGPDGRAVVETDMTDIGTGTYTILAQITGELLGLRPEWIDVRLGDTNAPPGAGSGGSWGASSSGSSVYLACEALRAKIASAMGCAVEELTLKDGRAIAQNRTALLTALVGEGMSAEGTIKPGKLDDERRQASYGAHFCEVRVNAITGEVRVNRFVSTFAAGRILNEKTARSQCIGGIVFGIGAALGEELVHDPRSGRVVNHDLAEYHVPVNADVPHLEVHFLAERDQFANPLQSKGLGELGISGAGAAVANAIYNATGVRVRDYPLTLDKLLAGLPAV